MGKKTGNRIGGIKTTGALRQFLTEIMIKVENGDIELDKASRITKLAGQVNESFYSEVKIAKLKAEAGSKAIELGLLLVGETPIGTAN